MAASRPTGLLLALLAALSSCGKDEAGPQTGLSVEVAFDSSLGLDALAVSVQGEDGREVLPRRAESLPVFLEPPGERRVVRPVISSAGLLTEPLVVWVEGLGGEEVRGVGRVEARLVPGQMVPLFVRLGPPAVCGDGRVDLARAGCADGHTAGGDGCSPRCQIEPGWTCLPGSPSRCGRCGNGILEAGEACDDGNTRDGDGCSAQCTREDARPRILTVEALQPASTESREFVDVPGATLSFTPQAANETWLVFVSGRLGSSDAGELSAEARLLLNGEEIDFFGHQTLGEEDNAAGFLTFEAIGETTAPQTVTLQFRAELGVTTVDTVRLVAALAPGGADVQYLRSDRDPERVGVDLTLDVLEIAPRTESRYLILGKMSMTEAPGGETARGWIEDGRGWRHPQDERGVRWSMARASLAPMVAAFFADVGAEGTKISLAGSSSGRGSMSGWWDPAWPMLAPLRVESSNRVVPDGYALSVTFDHAAEVARGRSRADGQDVRVVATEGERRFELDRVLDDDSGWNRPDTTLWFRVPPSLSSDVGYAFHLYLGHRSAGSPPADPLAVFTFHEDFGRSTLDERWSAESRVTPPMGGLLRLGPGQSLRTADRYAFSPRARLEARLRFSVESLAPTGYLVAPAIEEGSAVPSRGFATLRELSHVVFDNAGQVASFEPDSPLSFHRYAFFETEGNRVVFSQDDREVAVLQGVPNNAHRLGLGLENGSAGTIIYDWVRVRPMITPEPRVIVQPLEGSAGILPSRWRHRRLLALRVDAWADVRADFSPGLESTTSSSFEVKHELWVEAPPRPTEDLVLQLMRMSGDSSGTARKRGELRAGGAPLLATSHKINRDGGDQSGYHHPAAVVHGRRSDDAVVYQNGFASPDGIRVEAAASTIVVLRYPPE